MRTILFVISLATASVSGADIEALRRAGCPAHFVSAVQTAAQYASAGDVPDELSALTQSSEQLSAEQQRVLQAALRQHEADKSAWEKAIVLLQRHWEQIEELASSMADAILGDLTIPIESLLLDIPEFDEAEYANPMEELRVFSDISPDSVVESVLDVRVEQNLDQRRLGKRPKATEAINALTRQLPAEHVVVVFQQKPELQLRTADYLEGHPILSAAPTLLMGGLDYETRLVEDRLKALGDLTRFNQTVEGLFPEIRMNAAHIYCFGGSNSLVFGNALMEFVRVSFLSRDVVHVHLNAGLMYGLLPQENTDRQTHVSLGAYLRGRSTSAQARFSAAVFSEILSLSPDYRPAEDSVVADDDGSLLYSKSFVRNDGKKLILQLFLDERN